MDALILPFTEYIPAAVYDGTVYLPHWNNTDSAGSTDEPTATDETGSNQRFASALFPDARTAIMSLHRLLPADWYATAGIDLRLLWKSTATAGNVVWQIRTGFVADGAALDVAFNTAQTITDATKGTASRMNIASLSALTLTGALASSLMFLQVKRDPSHASDTLGANAALIGVELTYRRLVTLT